MSFSIRSKLMASHLAIVLLVTPILGIAGYFQMKRNLLDAQQQVLEFSAGHAASEIRALIAAREAQFERLAESREVGDFPETFRVPPLVRLFAGLAKEFPVLTYVNEEGYVEVKVVRGEEVSEGLNPSEKALIASVSTYPNTVIFGEVAFIPELGELGLPLSLGIRRYFGNEYVGSLHGVIPLGELSRLLEKFEVGKTGFFLCIDREGRLLHSPFPGRGLDVVTTHGGEMQGLLDQARAMGLGFGRGSIEGLDSLVAFAPIRKMRWSVFTVLPFKEFILGPNRLRNSVLIASGIFFLGGILLAYTLASNLAGPLRRLTSAAENAREGRVEVIEGRFGNDEIGSLVASFNRMVEDLRQSSISRNDLENIFRSMQEALLVVGLDGLVKIANPAAGALLRCSPQNMVGLPVDGLFKRPAAVEKAWIDKLLEGNPGFRSEQVLLTPGGQEIPVTFSWTLLENGLEQVEGVVLLAQEATPFQRGEEDGTKAPGLRDCNLRLREQVLQLESQLAEYQHGRRAEEGTRIETMARLATGLVQEIDGPAHFLQAQLDRMISEVEGALDDKGGQAEGLEATLLPRFRELERAVEAVVQAHTVLEIFASEEGGEALIDPAPVLLNAARSIPVCFRKHAVFRREIGDLPLVRCQARRLALAVTALLQNAFQAVTEGGEVVLKANLDDGSLWITVADNGPGIPAHRQEKIFEPFVSDWEQPGRRGLGLTLAREIARRYGGGLSVRSETGEGAQFALRLPAA